MHRTFFDTCGVVSHERLTTVTNFLIGTLTSMFAYVCICCLLLNSRAKSVQHVEVSEDAGYVAIRANVYRDRIKWCRKHKELGFIPLITRFFMVFLYHVSQQRTNWDAHPSRKVTLKSRSVNLASKHVGHSTMPHHGRPRLNNDASSAGIWFRTTPGFLARPSPFIRENARLLDSNPSRNWITTTKAAFISPAEVRKIWSLHPFPFNRMKSSCACDSPRLPGKWKNAEKIIKKRMPKLDASWADWWNISKLLYSGTPWNTYRWLSWTEFRVCQPSVQPHSSCSWATMLLSRIL